MDQPDTPNPQTRGDDVGRLIAQLELLQNSLSRVGEGMSALGDNAIRQSKDSENIAAHLLAVEAVLTVVIRQIPVDIAEVRAEVDRRSQGNGDQGEVDPLVMRLAEDLIKRSDD
ncbi:hypothetical protein N9L49_04580 [Rhodospirillales bacterium]|nr:hypothetical protein [Rhodospirillales bacterium]